MTKETLQKANAIQKTIETLESESKTIHFLYRKSDNLNKDDIEKLFLIANANTDYALKAMNKELSDL